MLFLNRLRAEVLAGLHDDEREKIKDQALLLTAVTRCDSLLRQLQQVQFSTLYDNYWELYQDTIVAIVDGLQRVPGAPQSETPGCIPDDLLFADRIQACSRRIPKYGSEYLDQEFYCKTTDMIGDLVADVVNYLKRYADSYYRTRLDSVHSLIMRWAKVVFTGSAIIVIVLACTFFLGQALTQRIQLLFYRQDLQNFLNKPYLDLFAPKTIVPPFAEVEDVAFERDGTTGVSFIWGMGPHTRIDFYCLRRQSMLLALTFSNSIPGQKVEVYINGHLLRTYSDLPRTAWLDSTVSEEIPFESLEGTNVITLRYGSWNRFNAAVSDRDNRRFAVAITRFRVVPTSVVQDSQVKGQTVP